LKRIVVLVAVISAALVLSSAALANGLTCAHGSTSCNSGKLGKGGTLPFTGLDLAGVAAIGGLLIVAGFTLQRASRRRG